MTKVQDDQEAVGRSCGWRVECLVLGNGVVLILCSADSIASTSCRLPAYGWGSHFRAVSHSMQSLLCSSQCSISLSWLTSTSWTSLVASRSLLSGLGTSSGGCSRALMRTRCECCCSQPVGELDLSANGIGEVGDYEDVLDVIIAGKSQHMFAAKEVG